MSRLKSSSPSIYYSITNAISGSCHQGPITQLADIQWSPHILGEIGQQLGQDVEDTCVASNSYQGHDRTQAEALKTAEIKNIISFGDNIHLWQITNHFSQPGNHFHPGESQSRKLACVDWPCDVLNVEHSWFYNHRRSILTAVCPDEPACGVSLIHFFSCM